MKKITFLLSFLTCVLSFGQSVATYNITFTNFWNATDHSIGTSFPASNIAHWSDLVGVNHNNNVTFVQIGTSASTGVENIAELGNWNHFRDNDVQDARDANNAERFFNAGDLFLNEPTNTIIYTGLEVSEDYPLLTMLSMIAPSPDWFIAINGLNLRNGSTWETSITMDLFPYDAGTEDGTGYSLSNNDTNDNITSAQGVAPFNSAKVATIEIELQSVLSNDEVSELDGISIFPNPVSDNLRLRNLQNTNLKHVEIYSVLGKLSRSVPIENNINNLDIDISDLASGIYVLKLQNEAGFSKTQKLIVR
ncbi:spondin domain-containing protein [Hyunsoonleella sp. SJ7]|uniref:Spondin domain-containing protein n=1 Tax=Hyunsoonleella aquatilis TaxID=2762758 RepID=A0A923KJV0_9FLAO|nr:spondin domain-containing protein [Hyunsoonleella aquatilis]MBC3757807.1 spondin domain-containing protein [Hyunsoonleella aquatilis]